MTLSEELQWRGFIQDTTTTNKHLDDTDWTFYHGFDASADSQTVGNLAAMMLDKVFMRHGHKAIILAGGATSLIGDPGGKDKERPIQTEETIAHNVAQAEKQLAKIFAGHDFILVNNLDWTRNLGVLPFLRDIGKHFSMTPLVQRDYIAQRMGEGGSGITYTEFSYTLLQGMDYLHLFDTYQCNLQIGGSDQWGNCLSGVELVRKARGAEVHAITLPLVINKATGKKFGKSEDGAVWLDPDKTSPYEFYQFWLNSDDEGVESYLKVFTELNQEQIDKIMNEHLQTPHLRFAQRRLAQETTRLVHSQEALDTIEQMSAVIFGGAQELSDSVVAMMVTELPALQITREEFDDLDLLQALLDLGLACSKTEARTFLASGAIKAGLTSIKLTEQVDIAVLHAAVEKDILLLRRGKNSLGVISING